MVSQQTHIISPPCWQVTVPPANFPPVWLHDAGRTRQTCRFECIQHSNPAPLYGWKMNDDCYNIQNEIAAHLCLNVCCLIFARPRKTTPPAVGPHAPPPGSGDRTCAAGPGIVSRNFHHGPLRHACVGLAGVPPWSVAPLRRLQPRMDELAALWRFAIWL